MFRDYGGAIDWLSSVMFGALLLVSVGIVFVGVDAYTHRDTVVPDAVVNGVQCYHHYGSLQIWCER